MRLALIGSSSDSGQCLDSIEARPGRIEYHLRSVPKFGSFDAPTPDGASKDPSLRLARATRGKASAGWSTLWPRI